MVIILDLNYVLSKEHTSEGIVILNNDHIYILENPYGVDLNIKIELQDIYSDEFDTPPVCKPPLFTLKVRIKKELESKSNSSDSNIGVSCVCIQESHLL